MEVVWRSGERGEETRTKQNREILCAEKKKKKFIREEMQTERVSERARRVIGKGRQTEAYGNAAPRRKATERLF